MITRNMLKRENNVQAVYNGNKQKNSLKQKIETDCIEITNQANNKLNLENEMRDQDHSSSISQQIMSEMCIDHKRGRKSSKFDDIEAIERQKRREARDRRKMKQFRKQRILTAQKIGTPLNEKDLMLDGKSDSKVIVIFNSQESINLNSSFENDQTQAPQVGFNPNSGKLEVLVETTMIDRSAGMTPLNMLPVREEDERYKIVNASTHGKREKTERWTQDEDQRFWKAISEWGTDFEIMSKIFPGRSRAQLKRKFLAEEKRNPEKISIFLSAKQPIDVEEYNRLSGHLLA